MQGEVLRWHNDHGATAMPAAEYITMLENEVAVLRKQVRQPSPCQAVRLWQPPPPLQRLSASMRLWRGGCRALSSREGLQGSYYHHEQFKRQC